MISNNEDFKVTLSECLAYAERENISGIFAYSIEHEEIFHKASGDVKDRIVVFDMICEEMNERSGDKIEELEEQVETLIHQN